MLNIETVICPKKHANLYFIANCVHKQCTLMYANHIETDAYFSAVEYRYNTENCHVRRVGTETIGLLVVTRITQGV